VYVVGGVENEVLLRPAYRPMSGRAVEVLLFKERQEVEEDRPKGRRLVVGTRIASSTAMTAMTTRSSIRVTPGRRSGFEIRNRNVLVRSPAKPDRLASTRNRAFRGR
jgi:hypothetical protein